MNPRRVAIKLFVTPDPAAAVDLEPAISLFHRFIQERRVEGLLIDVADYAHVPEGPGVLLVGHDVDYGIDLAGGRVGLLTTRKRYADLPLAEVVRDTLRKALTAAREIEKDATLGLRFAADSFLLQWVDRLVLANDEAGFRALRAEILPVLEKLYPGCEVTRAHADDPRRPLAVSVAAGQPVDRDALIERLSEGRVQQAQPAPARDPRQSDWDISVEDLKKLRDEGADFVLVDVRESDEYAICNLDGRLIPLGSLPERLGELDRDAHVVVHCKVGGRGAKAVGVLREAGFGNSWNVAGGILAWIERIDPSLTGY